MTGNRLDDAQLPPHVVGHIMRPEDCKKCAKNVRH